MTSLRLGLVGAGAQAADVIVPALMSTPGTSLAAIGSADGSARELAETWGGEGVQAEVDEFLGVGEFDAAVVASTPVDSEAALATAQRLGLPVYLAGPPASGAGALREYKRANADRDTPLTSAVGLHLRYAATTRAALERVAAHGRVVHVAMDCHVDGPRTGLWGRELLDTFLLSSGLHPLAVMADVLGWPEVGALTSGEVTQTRRDDCFVTADFTTRTARGSLRMSNTRNRLDFAATITCQDGTSVTWNLDEVVTYRPGTAEEARFVPGAVATGWAGHAAALAEFRDAVNGKTESRATVEQVVVVMEWIERLRAS
jgi:predicted dehydrogenase